MMELLQAESAEHLREARQLFEEYAASLGFSLCFQDFEKELARLPGDYAPPRGRLLLAFHQGQAAGCVALHPFPLPGDNAVCEMKRLFVRPRFRGLGIGRMLGERIVAEARAVGYRRMRLDTIPSIMADAVALYRRMGFKEIPAYRQNPIAGALYMELELAPAPRPVPLQPSS